MSTYNAFSDEQNLFSVPTCSCKCDNFVKHRRPLLMVPCSAAICWEA